MDLLQPSCRHPSTFPRFRIPPPPSLSLQCSGRWCACHYIGHDIGGVGRSVGETTPLLLPSPSLFFPLLPSPSLPKRTRNRNGKEGRQTRGTGSRIVRFCSSLPTNLSSALSLSLSARGSVAQMATLCHKINSCRQNFVGSCLNFHSHCSHSCPH